MKSSSIAGIGLLGVAGYFAYKKFFSGEEEDSSFFGGGSGVNYRGAVSGGEDTGNSISTTGEPTFIITDEPITNDQLLLPTSSTKKESNITVQGYSTSSGTGKAIYKNNILTAIEDPVSQQSRKPTAQEIFTGTPSFGSTTNPFSNLASRGSSSSGSSSSGSSRFSITGNAINTGSTSTTKKEKKSTSRSAISTIFGKSSFVSKIFG
jgi:hypothetical protein